MDNKLEMGIKILDAMDSGDLLYWKCFPKIGKGISWK